MIDFEVGEWHIQNNMKFENPRETIEFRELKWILKKQNFLGSGFNSRMKKKLETLVLCKSLLGWW